MPATTEHAERNTTCNALRTQSCGETALAQWDFQRGKKQK